MRKITTTFGDIKLPAFMPDATYGSVKSVSFADLKDVKIEQIVTTTLHIENKIGSLYINKVGGLHKFFNWNRPILTDSGGWQVFSLINSDKNTKHKISSLGCSFLDSNTGKYTLLTPESSVIIQNNLMSDIITVLDNPILTSSSLLERTNAVKLNTLWAKRSKDTYTKLKNDSNHKPLIGCVIQGASDFTLRKRSAEELVDIDFDIFNFGGVPTKDQLTWKEDSETGLYKDLLSYVADLIPKDKFKYAMGIGRPEDISYCIDAGWDLFDTVIPTRNARHGYLFVAEGNGDVTKTFYSQKLNKKLSYDILHIRSERYKFSQDAIDATCDCACCKNVSKNYLRHLIRIRETSGIRLATLHNLRFYSRFMEQFNYEPS